MKISVMGYCGSGKSTLARCLGEQYGLAVLHLDTIHFLPAWEERGKDERYALYLQFLAEHPDGWVIDGNYSALDREARMEEADEIVLLLFPRLISLWRCIRRYFQNRRRVRSCMAEGCEEKLDLEFIKWILFDSRTKRARAFYRSVIDRYPQKVTVLKSQRQINAYKKQKCC